MGGGGGVGGGASQSAYLHCVVGLFAFQTVHFSMLKSMCLQTAKTLIRLYRCADWPSLAFYIIKYIFPMSRAEIYTRYFLNIGTS